MIVKATKQKMPDEVSAWTVATGMLPVPPFIPKKSNQAIEFIKKLDGFLGIFPCGADGTLWLFESLNKAKVAKNKMDAKGIATGDNICEVFVNKMYLRGKHEE